MLEIKLKQIEKRIDNQINLRSAYFAIVIALTGSAVTFMYKFSVLNSFLLIISIILDFYFLLAIKFTTKKINILIKKMEEM